MIVVTIIGYLAMVLLASSLSFILGTLFGVVVRAGTYIHEPIISEFKKSQYYVLATVFVPPAAAALLYFHFKLQPEYAFLILFLNPIAQIVIGIMMGAPLVLHRQFAPIITHILMFQLVPALIVLNLLQFFQ